VLVAVLVAGTPASATTTIDDAAITAFSRSSGRGSAATTSSRRSADDQAQVDALVSSKPSGSAFANMLVATVRPSTGRDLAGPVTLRLGSRAVASAPTNCSLFQPGADRVPASECMSCHGLHQTHPVEIDYAAAAARRPEFYRSLAEATRVGLFIPDGQVKCVTCHDPNSPWKYKIALPPGAKPSPAVEAMTVEQLSMPKKRLAAVTPPPGSAVTPTPLCMGCHLYGN
jgi:hypothetical protein